jgi:pimeloyl-ACP methyl ester carboxylesterase
MNGETLLRVAPLALRAALLALLISQVGACSRTAAGVGPSGAGDLYAAGQLGPCSPSGHTKPVDPRGALAVLVHGCNASQGRFTALADLFELHGQQTLCFRYDDRRRVGDVARELRGALAELAGQREIADLTVLGHSQGGLVARAALARSQPEPLASRAGPLNISLVTVSAPFHGIEAAADCGARWLHALSLGATLAICRAIAGPKWRDIHPHAELVQHPGQLSGQVGSHIEIRTDERNTCRTVAADGKCVEADYVFSLQEQKNLVVDDDLRVTPDLVAAGHAEIVGREDAPPRKLLSVLQRHGVLGATPADKQAALQALFERLF